MVLGNCSIQSVEIARVGSAANCPPRPEPRAAVVFVIAAPAPAAKEFV